VERRALDFLATLCATYTPAGREAALLPPIEAELRRLGARVEAYPLEGAQGEGRANLLASWGESRVLFSTHLDVVPPELPVRAAEGFVAGRGACDAKGQIGAQLGAIELLLASGIRDIAWLGVAGEESDSAGARASLALAPSFSACRAIIVGEPTGCALATGQRGYVRARLTCKGKAAHGATPELGENALLALMDWLSAVRKAGDERGPEGLLGGEAWNLGLISGGRAANVVPDLAQAEIALRTVPDGAMRDALESSRPEHGSIEILVDDPWALFDTPAGFPAAPVPFASDLAVMRALAPRAAAILAGPGRASLAHTGAEELTLEELSAGIALFRDLGLRYLSNSALAKGSI
jgi:acetylornithine deacetylase